MLGRTLCEAFGNDEVVVADLPECDITDRSSIAAFFAEADPDVVIHAAAMTNVDGCEADSALAYRINEEGTRNVAIVSAAMNARLIAISTDYVFSGELEEGRESWSEEDTPRPRTVYGASKFAGEEMIRSIYPEAVVLRIAWLYGAGGPSFVHTMVKLLSAEGDPVKVVNDQFGNPTSAAAVADAIRFILSKPSLEGTVHATCEGAASWYDLASELKKLLPSLKRELVPCTTAEFPRPAPRPANSVLEKRVLGLLGYTMPNWRLSLADFVASEFLTV
jgi:dTDP-4-dehydrorhamnose reductase